MAGMAGAPGAWATCPAKTADDWWANIVTPAAPPAPPVYSQTIPPPGVEFWLRPANEPPSAASAWANVGQVAAPVVAAAVVVVVADVAAVDDGEVAGVVVGDVGLVVALVPPELQPVITRPAVRAPTAITIRRLSTRRNLRPSPSSGKGHGFDQAGALGAMPVDNPRSEPCFTPGRQMGKPALKRLME
jgi:hypothetical protein